MVSTGNSGAERVSIWLALILAVLSPIAAIGGAWFAGQQAKEGIQLQFEQQRRAEVADLRQRTYVDFLRVAEKNYLAKVGNEQEMHAAETQVLIVGSPNVRKTASLMARSALTGNETEYNRA